MIYDLASLIGGRSIGLCVARPARATASATKRPRRRRRRAEFETLDDARRVIGDYIDHRHPNRPHSRLGYRTPLELRQTWEDGRALLKSAA